jgi:radical SAM-linked protein
MERPNRSAEIGQAEPRQRWRLIVRRRSDAPPLAQREQVAAWEAALASTGLPLAMTGGGSPRPRFVTAAPLPVGMAAERELFDLFLTERRPVADVRERLAAALPAGHELLDLHDVWLGSPPLPDQLAAADYEVELAADDGNPLEPTVIADAARRLLSATSLPRRRERSGRSIDYDLRPLVIDVDVASHEPLTVLVRARFHPERGVGRPEEVVAALGELAGRSIVPVTIVRARQILTTD